MNNMLTVIIVSVSGLIFLTSVITLLIKRYRKLESRGWKVGDLISIAKDIDHGVELYELAGWSQSAIYVNTKSGVTKLERSLLNYNKSAVWRSNHEECSKFMGCEPGFTPKLENKEFTERIDGKPIELLTEIECQVYLKQAIDTEDYKLAEAIRKRMEKFR